METYTPFEKLALQSINTDELNLPNNATDFEKIKAVIDRFTVEYYSGRKFITQELKEWLQGLPSILDFPFYYHDQLAWAKSEGLDVSTPEKEEVFYETFFARLAHAFVTLNGNL